ncbi:MAG: tRNA (N(6)-L-threonylcarbamoyladenosine(37)-C(2))-methylthiotransferase MtaB [Clostridia bacterium]|nr:tRNA (N(6)-L-threonylcarbamoyladenosine(37)-C(2))-methylthiotransferase MtaB [Clostridia bacterium]
MIGEKKAVVFTLGCKVNDVESGSIIRALEEMGLSVSRELGFADIFVFNTCAVTAEAERKSRQAIGKAFKYNPQAKVVVCGCASQKSPNDFFEKDDRVAFVTGAAKKGGVIQAVERLLGGDIREKDLPVFEKEYEELPMPKCLKTRNFVKIQDGCNRFCSYCVIPYLRGRSRSRELESAAKEILSSTAEETVVTGIDISDYKDSKGRDLADLLNAVKDAHTRIRLGSLEVSAVTERLLTAAKGVRSFAPQFHLSLQSGSNAVLRSMNRHYTREEYLEKCKMIYSAFENASITTDIIVGFPTETEEDHALTLSIIEEAGFSQIHAFPYSPREGTNAFKRYKELPSSVKKERLEAVLKKGAEQKKKYALSMVGKTLEIVPERYENGCTEGYSENYIRVYAQGKTGTGIMKVRVTGLVQDGVSAVIEKE